jgi:hypothetical protein
MLLENFGLIAALWEQNLKMWTRVLIHVQAGSCISLSLPVGFITCTMYSEPLYSPSNFMSGL